MAGMVGVAGVVRRVRVVSSAWLEDVTPFGKHSALLGPTSSHADVRCTLMPMCVRAPSQCPYRSGMEEPTESQSRRTGMRTRPAFLFLTALALVSCNDSSPTPTRLVGAHRLALAVPA